MQKRLAIAFSNDAVETLQIPREVFREIGKINRATPKKGRKHNKDYAAHLSNLGESYKELDAKEIREITGISYYTGRLFTTGTVMLHPALYARILEQI